MARGSGGGGGGGGMGLRPRGSPGLPRLRWLRGTPRRGVAARTARAAAVCLPPLGRPIGSPLSYHMCTDPPLAIVGRR